jgi:glycine/D-amino acid oxidase-like deaminating enzyme
MTIDGDRARHVPPVAARSYWLLDALARDPGVPCPALSETVRADVCIAGGGFTGLWTAYELSAQNPGLAIVLLEARICGAGASGANGGFFAASWHDVLALDALHGEEPALRYTTLLAAELDALTAWCTTHRADVGLRRDGMLYARAGRWQPPPDGELLEWLADRSLRDRLHAVTADEARAVARSPLFLGGMFTPDAATLQPARLARELRRVLLERGVRIFEHTPLLGVRSGGTAPAGWRSVWSPTGAGRPAATGTGAALTVATPWGAVDTDTLVVATGAWAAGHPPFRRAFAVTVDYVVATEPVPELLEELGWTDGTGIIDGRKAIYYLRRTGDGRVVIGGGSLGVAYAARIGGRAMRSQRKADVPAAGLALLFPTLAGVRIDHAWSGPIDATATHLPFFQTSPCGRIHAGLGFSGHGLAAAKLGGRTLASLALRADDEWTQVPVVGPPTSAVPPEPFRWPLVKGLSAAVIRGELAQERGERAGVAGSVAARVYRGYRRSRLKRPRQRPD